jgi:hypothetical protein
MGMILREKTQNKTVEDFFTALQGDLILGLYII